MMGFIACWLHLAYALYLIAHHDEIPKPLLHLHFREFGHVVGAETRFQHNEIYSARLSAYKKRAQRQALKNPYCTRLRTIVSMISSRELMRPLTNVGFN